MRLAVRVGAVACGAIVACTFTTNESVPMDGPRDTPDSGPCVAASAECVGDVLRVCSGPGATAVDTTCAWGCGSSSPHCLQVVPAGGVIQPGDVGVGSDALLDITLGAGTIVNPDGSIKVGTTTLRAAGSGVIAGIDFEARGSNAAVFRFRSLTIAGPVYLRGKRALALVADGAIDVASTLDARGPCDTGTAGPGGFVGGAKGVAGLGGGGGASSTGQSAGGGGAGYGGSGGSGGNGPSPTTPIAGGAPQRDAIISVLVGGAGGGGGGAGGGGQTGTGGGGGGAVQLVSNSKIQITGGINAGGCGGRSGSGANDGGGGGGAGGTILLEAPVIAVPANGALAVNGGGGGGGAANNTAYAPAGQLSRSPANGASGGAIGGIGGAANMLDGGAGGTTGGKGAGGGGAVGRIRLNTKSGSASIDAAAILSPAPSDVPTTCTQGTPTLQ